VYFSNFYDYLKFALISNMAYQSMGHSKFFFGMPSMAGRGAGPLPMREGMNRFLKMVGITFRRDADTKRPRINKLGSRLDKEQKEKGEYYYSD